jgi:thiosulfate/3-mercaptopyruvate sulfurtransferase
MFTTLIDAGALEALAPDAVALFDCSFDLSDPAAGHRRFLEAHVPGARYLHLDRDLAGTPDGSNGRHPLPDPECFAKSMRANGLRTGQQVVAYDASGGAFAARLWWLLRWIGHDAVAVLDGGIQAWMTAGGRTVSGEPDAPLPGDFVAAPREGWTVDAEAVLANIDAEAFTVLDARSAGRFRGEPNPMDPVPGRIPGARNRFYGDNLAEDGRFKPAAVLAEEFDAILQQVPARGLVLQCGSGVTACHNALALELIGRSGARLYPGSWSEWISDPVRPVARG